MRRSNPVALGLLFTWTRGTIIKFFDADPDPGSWILLTLGPGIRDKHPGSAILLVKYRSLFSFSPVIYVFYYLLPFSTSIFS